jgi:hypothetical protein
MRTLDFINDHVLDGRGEQPIEIPATYRRDTLEVPVNGKRDLFVQTTRKRKTGSIRFDHSEIFTNTSTRGRAKTLMNSTARQDEADSLVGNVCAIFVCDRSAAVKIQSVKYVRFKDIQLHEFKREGITDSDEKLDIDMYRCLPRRVWYTCYHNVLNDDDFVCLFEFEMLPANLHLNYKTSGVKTCEKICGHRFMTGLCISWVSFLVRWVTELRSTRIKITPVFIFEVHRISTHHSFNVTFFLPKNSALSYSDANKLQTGTISLPQLSSDTPSV